eukprot:m.695214 g.695214  ORF g.695214 m.695214 type:complete len:345 (-) comp22887_c0_seq2:1930-2964(-)
MAAASVNHSLQDILNDLCTRFLINIPEEHLQDGIRIFFVIEQAHWFYDDYFRTQDPSLPQLNFPAFAQTILSHWPPFHHLVSKTGEIYTAWKKYKQGVPVCGALILNAQCTKVVMVRSWGSNPMWGFPKGKINDKESKLTCAVREVYEETGFDVKEYVNETDFIELKQGRQNMTLFIAAGVPENTHFEPQARNEISKVGWFKINNVISKKYKQPMVCVAPQVAKKLKTWLTSTDNGCAMRARLCGTGAAVSAAAVSSPQIPSTVDALLRALQGGAPTTAPTGTHALNGSSGAPSQEVSRAAGNTSSPLLLSGDSPTDSTKDPMLDFAFDRAKIMQHFDGVVVLG